MVFVLVNYMALAKDLPSFRRNRSIWNEANDEAQNEDRFDKLFITKVNFLGRCFLRWHTGLRRHQLQASVSLKNKVCGKDRSSLSSLGR